MGRRVGPAIVSGLPECKFHGALHAFSTECRVLTALQAEKMELLEKTQGWKEEEFDIVLQYLRTVLLKRECTQEACWNYMVD